MASEREYSTVVELLQARACQRPDFVAYTFLGAGNEDARTRSYRELEQRAKAIAAWLQKRVPLGGRVLLLYPPGLDYLDAFFGCLFAGVIAVPVYPPLRSRGLARLRQVAQNSGARVALTTARFLRLSTSMSEQAPELAALDWGCSDDIAVADGADWRLPAVDGRSIAFLQYTSGSTRAPRGVVISHRNLLLNEEVICASMGHDDTTIGVSWLPLYHDMGLIGMILQPLYVGGACYFMSPGDFLQSPIRWLRAISRYRATTCAAPNFAYDYCVRKVRAEDKRELDLSSWSVAINGAEPVRAATMDRFAEAFAECGFRRESFYPSYGLAEATLLVTGGASQSLPRRAVIDKRALEQNKVKIAAPSDPGSVTLVSSGHAWLGHRVEVVDPDSRTLCPPGGVGEIWVSGGSVAQGYWNNAEETAKTFGATLANAGDQERFLRTGDLGFLLEGELFVTGRAKEMIIICGANYYPHDIETAVEGAHPALRPGHAAAFSIDDETGERLVLVHEVDPRFKAERFDDVFEAVRRAVVVGQDIEVGRIALVAPGQVPKTSSGKTQRAKCRAQLLARELTLIAEWRSDECVVQHDEGRYARGETDTALKAEPTIEDWLVARLAASLHLERSTIDLHAPFASYGVDSVRGQGLLGELSEWLGEPISPTAIYEYPTVASLAAALTGPLAGGVSVDARTPRGLAAPAEPIAICGIGCRFPGATGPREFWSLLRDRRDALVDVPGDRWNAKDVFDPDPMAPGKTNARRGGFIGDIDLFDRQFFSINASEATAMDPQQRLLLEVTWEALENAGIVPSSIAGTDTGVFVGVSTSEYGRFFELDSIDGYTGSGNAFSIAANRISYVFDLRGPSVAVDTACSSSLVAVHLACQALRSGEASMALAAGVNLLLTPNLAIAFSKAGMMSATGACHAFDAGADGYVRGEGIGVVVLKPLSRAEEDGDRIYAVIRGSAVNHDGRSNGLTAPNPRAQVDVIRQAHRAANVDGQNIEYVEAHGTGTPLGDPIEARALGEAVGVGRDATNPCLIGSVKTNIGHLEAAAGIAGLVKTALALHYGEVPPNLHFSRSNPHIALNDLRLRVVTEPTPLGRSGRALAGVSSFGFGGTNAHVVLERTRPTRESAGAETGPGAGSVIVPVSARSWGALRGLTRRYAHEVRRGGERNLLAMAGAAARFREHHALRFVARGRTVDEVASMLENFNEEAIAPPALRGTGAGGSRVAFVFSGQGAQWARMGSELLASEPFFKRALEECDEAFRRIGGISVLELVDADDDSLDRTENAQPAIFAMQVALAALYRAMGVVPDVVVGHSVGEIAAAYTAGALDLDQAVTVVLSRGAAMMSAKGRGRMVVVALNEEAARAECAGFEEDVSIAAVNGSQATVISGGTALVEQLTKQLEARGTPVTGVRVDYAFHSPQMDEARHEVIRRLAALTPQEGAVAMMSTVTGEPIDGKALTAEYWGKNVRDTVRFASAIDAAIDRGCEIAVEIAPHNVLARDVKEAFRRRGREHGSVIATMRRGANSGETFLNALGDLYEAGCDVRWQSVYPAARRVELPTYAWQGERFWIKTTARPASNGRHPLLGDHVALASGSHAWFGEIGVDSLPFLSDHRLRGASVVPAALYLEMAAAAGRTLGTPAVIELSLSHVLTLNSGDRWKTQILVEPIDGRPQVSIHGRNQDGEQPWALLARGFLGEHRETASAPALVDIQLRCLQQVTAPHFYNLLTARGLQYGPSFRGVAQVWRGEGEALAKLQPDSDAIRARDFGLHPAILDAGFHVVAATQPSFLDQTTGGLFVPTKIERFEQVTAAAPFYSYAFLKSDGTHDATTIVADVSLLDAGGNVAATVIGLTLERVGGTNLRHRERNAGHLYEVVWRQASPPPPTTQMEGRWLILADESGIGAALARFMRAQRQDCVVVGRMGTVQPVDWEIDHRDPAALERLVRQELGPNSGPVRGVVHLWACDAPDPIQSVGDLVGAQELGVGSVVRLVKALTFAAAGSPRLWLVTRGAQSVEGESPNLSQAPVWGLAKAIVFEHPDLKCSRLDLDPKTETPIELIGNLFTEGEPEDQIAIRRGLRWGARLISYEPRACERGRPRLDPSGVYLVTGGYGALGLAMARWLATVGAKHLVLVGRRGPGAVSEATIADLRADGVEVICARADIASEDEAASLVEQVCSARPLRGVIHAAGVLDDAPILHMDDERLWRVMAPKVAGAWNLHTLTKGMNLDLFVLFSSIVSVVGSPGQSNYAAANMFLDALAHARRSAGLTAMSINWGPWAEAGMAAERASSAAGELVNAGLLHMFEPADAVQMFERAYFDDVTQIAALPFDLRDLVQFFPVGPGIAFFRDLLGEDIHLLRSVGAATRLNRRPRLATDYVAPRNDIEQTIASMWQRALDLDRVGVHDSFFELGGDSVFGSQIVAQVNKTFGISVKVGDAFHTFTIAKLAEMVDSTLVAKLQTMSDSEVEKLLMGGNP